jgi:AmmeMemoRadiSam system protein B
MSVKQLAHEGETYAALLDPLGIVAEPLLVPIEAYHRVVRNFDGATTLPEIQARVMRQTGQLVPLAELEELVDQLDRALALDGPAFAEYREAYRRELVRPAALAGRSYAGTERALRAQLAQFFAHANGAGMPLPADGAPSRRLRGILSPHIDFYRGGPVYTWSYRELVERSDADTFVILGVAHQHCRRRFALTRKDFETPLGLAPTDRTYVDRIAALAGQDLFEDELTHRTEHSIEFQVVFLQYLLGGRRDFSIVPILVGSFHDLMDDGTDPIENAEVRRFVDALRAAESASGKSVMYIGGIDLCHVGPDFGDPDPVDRDTLSEVRRFDEAMLDRAAASDAAGWFGTAAEVGNRWRVCGLAATYTMLHAMGPAQGRLLRYDQAVDVRRTCCVTFASLAFERPDDVADAEAVADADAEV